MSGAPLLRGRRSSLWDISGPIEEFSPTPGEPRGGAGGQGGGARTPTDQAAQLMDLLGLSEDELCQILDVDPLSLISGQLEHATQLPILLDLVAEPRERVGGPVLRQWLRAAGPEGRPVDALLRRDFAAFEDALAELEDRGFVLRRPEQP